MIKRGFIFTYFLFLIPIISLFLIKINEKIKNTTYDYLKTQYIIKNDIVLKDLEYIILKNLDNLKKYNLNINDYLNIKNNIQGIGQNITISLLPYNTAIEISNSNLKIKNIKKYLNILSDYYNIQDTYLFQNIILKTLLNKDKYIFDRLEKACNKYKKETGDMNIDKFKNNINKIFSRTGSSYKEKQSFFNTEPLLLSIILNTDIKYIKKLQSLDIQKVKKTLTKDNLKLLQYFNIDLINNPNIFYIVSIIIKEKEIISENKLLLNYKKGIFIETHNYSRYSINK